MTYDGMHSKEAANQSYLQLFLAAIATKPHNSNETNDLPIADVQVPLNNRQATACWSEI